MGLKEAGLRGSLRNVSETTPAFYDVQITGTNEPITEGDTLDVNYQVQNTEDQDGIKDVFLEIDTVEEDRDSNISLSGGATATGTLQWVTQNGEAGTYNAVVLSPDDSDSVSVSVGAGAIPDSAVDNFEPVLYEDQSRTLSDYYNDVGNTAALTVQRQQTTVLEDSYSLELEGNDSAAQVISTGTADLPNTPVQGDSFRVKLRGTATSSIPAFRYGVQSSGSHYELRLDIPNDSIALLKDGTEQSSTAATLSQSTTYDPTLQWAGDGQQTLTLNDDGGVDQSVSFTDTAYTSGEVGWFVTRSEFINPAMIGDHARII